MGYRVSWLCTCLSVGGLGELETEGCCLSVGGLGELETEGSSQVDLLYNTGRTLYEHTTIIIIIIIQYTVYSSFQKIRKVLKLNTRNSCYGS